MQSILSHVYMSGCGIGGAGYHCRDRDTGYTAKWCSSVLVSTVADWNAWPSFFCSTGIASAYWWLITDEQGWIIGRVTLKRKTLLSLALLYCLTFVMMSSRSKIWMNILSRLIKNLFSEYCLPSYYQIKALHKDTFGFERISVEDKTQRYNIESALWLIKHLFAVQPRRTYEAL